jgi:hypothetical protein
MTRFLNNLHQAAHNQKIRRSNNIKIFWSKHIKESKQDSQGQLRSPMSEEEEP